MFEGTWKCREHDCGQGEVTYQTEQCPVMAACPNPPCPTCGVEMHLRDWRQISPVSFRASKVRQRKGRFNSQQLELF